MTIEEKHKIVYIGGKRYYDFDMTEKLPFLDEAVPYLFKYKDIEINESSWNKMALKILEAIDSINPKTNAELLSISYYWSKQAVFSETKRTNHTPFRDLWLNTNHSSTHSMMSIQCLLEAYGVDLSQCYFLVRRHFISEPQEVKDYIRGKTIKGFKKSLELRGFEQKRIDTIVNNFTVINKHLGKVTSGYNDFFLFDDYNYFYNYKVKTLEEAKKTMLLQEKNYKIICRCLGYLEDFYKNKNVYDWIFENGLNEALIETAEKEINLLFDNLGSELIVSNKLYGRMNLLHRKEMSALGGLDNPEGLFRVLSISLTSKFFFKEPYISKSPIGNLTNDQIIYAHAYTLDSFTISSLNAYIDKMHLKRLDNYMEFLEELSKDYVQTDIETMVSKRVFEISETQISELKNELAFFINSFGKIDSEKYVGYESLPKAMCEWNKYLLLGLIRTYLNNDFSIDVSGSNYKTLSYIIDIKQKG